MPACTNCGRHVSTDYARVLGDGDGDVHGCPVCEASPVAGVA